MKILLPKRRDLIRVTADTAEVWNLALWAAPLLYHLPTKLHHQLPSRQLRSTWWAGNSTCKISLRGNTSWKLCKQVGLAQLCASMIYNKKSRVHFLWNFITALSLEEANSFSSIIVIYTTIGINGACRVCYPEAAGWIQPPAWAGGGSGEWKLLHKNRHLQERP